MGAALYVAFNTLLGEKMKTYIMRIFVDSTRPTFEHSADFPSVDMAIKYASRIAVQLDETVDLFDEEFFITRIEVMKVSVEREA